MELLTKLKGFMRECIRVFRITKKPSKAEYKVVMKVSSIGILLIGFIGFIIQIVWELMR
ncbi:MAG: protein translocase SEC61 complex subunit gamma [Nanoarchaeota archaeon]